MRPRKIPTIAEFEAAQRARLEDRARSVVAVLLRDLVASTTGRAAAREAPEVLAIVSSQFSEKGWHCRTVNGELLVCKDPLVEPRAPVATPPATPPTITLREHPAWPVPLFSDEARYGEKNANGNLRADSEICLKVCIVHRLHVSAVAVGTVPVETTLDAILRRWGSPTDEVAYEVRLFTRAEGGTRAPRHYLCSRRIHDRDLPADLPADQRAILGTDLMALPTSAPRWAVLENARRERARQEKRA